MSHEEQAARDAFIQAQIDRTIEPYVAIAPPALLEMMRSGLEDTLRTYEPAVAIIDQLAARAAPNFSAEGAAAGQTHAAPDKAGGKEGA
jgi:long-subunit acyl-CoA synthetase (AMP-forming)